jgi:ABC-type uncharacterized transport system involved in gliding motility auxiliary subunit
MKPEWRRFAPIGLYLSLFGAAAAVILYIVFKEFNLYVQISVGLFIIGLALFAILDPDRVRAALTGRQARHGGNALVMALAFIGILVVVNYLISQNSQRWDLTEDKSNTLASETLETLERLPQAVEAQGFFSPQVDRTQAEDLLRQYSQNSNDRFEYQFIDPVADPISAQDAGITRDGTVVLTMGDRSETLTAVSETELTKGLVRLMADKVSVYFLTGHGEASLLTGGERGLASAKAALEAKSYVVNELNLISTNTIPEDAKVIVIAGPTQPLRDTEVERLKGFLERGGSLVVMDEPPVLTEIDQENDPLGDFLTQTYGITLGNDFVLDYSSSQPNVAVAEQYADHPITESFQSVVSFYPTARSVQPGEAEGNTSQTLVLTSANSWAETDIEGLVNDEQPQPDERVDLMGPVPLAVTAQSQDGGQRVVVFGDVDYATDMFINQYGNSDMFVNSVDWAAEQETLINLTQPDPTQRLIVPPRSYTQGLIQLVSIFLPAGVLLIAGVVVWVQRRRRG